MAKLYDRRDVDFLLYDVLHVDELTQYDRFKEHSKDMFDMVLDTAERIAHEEIAPTDAEGDRHGTVYKDGEVITPESFKKVHKIVQEGGWHLLTEDAELGGQQLPHAVAAHAGGVMSGANFAFSMLTGLTVGAGHLIEAFGTDEQKKKYLEPMLAGRYAGTMCLTEPHAGTDVGSLSTTARKNPDGTYTIKGQKIFISWGDHNVTENIIHPVLARIEGDPAGTKGISIFLVPKYRLNEDGSPGERNDVECTGVEHKLGIHASPTCQLSFGDNDECVGELLGEEREGMKIMFRMMNGARFEVGLQGLIQSEPAYQYALEYAIDRKQGSSIKDFKNPEAPRVPIVTHPNVRRMLMDMKAKVEGMRALIGFTALQLDLNLVAEGADADTANSLVELLTPIVKSWCTDTGFRVAENAIQVLGGHGFLQDHPVEQYLRDLKIGSIYEGTNGIQAMDLLGRKLGMKGGQVFMTLLMNVDETTGRVKEMAELKDEAELVAALRGKLAETAMGLGQTFQGGDLELPLLNAKPFLDAMAEVVVAWLLLWQGEVAQHKLEALLSEHGVSGDEAVKAFAHGNPDAGFYYSKVRTAKYFINRVLPETRAKLDVLGSTERAALEVVFSGEQEAATA